MWKIHFCRFFFPRKPRLFHILQGLEPQDSTRCPPSSARPTFPAIATCCLGLGESHGVLQGGSHPHKPVFLPSKGAISDCFQLFPLGHLWTFKKQTALCGNAHFEKNAGWTSFGLIMFPTVSDRFSDPFSDRFPTVFRPFPTVSFFLND